MFLLNSSLLKLKYSKILIEPKLLFLTSPKTSILDLKFLLKNKIPKNNIIFPNPLP